MEAGASAAVGTAVTSSIPEELTTALQELPDLEKARLVAALDKVPAAGGDSQAKDMPGGQALAVNYCTASQKALALAKAMRTGLPTEGLGENVYGRVCFVRPHSTHLVASHMPYTFVADGHFWASLSGLGARELLTRVGLGDLDLDAKAAEGVRFKLVLFDSTDDVFRADWAGVQRLVEEKYPSVADKIRPHWHALQTKTYTELGGDAFEDAEKKEGPMVAEQYEQAEDTEANARRFLKNTFYCTHHFKGDGYSYDGDVRQSAEYFAPNRAFSSLAVEQVIDIDF